MTKLAKNGLAEESVWDYPRPPRVEPCLRRVRVVFEGRTIADSGRALRVLETASPPTIYVPAADLRTDLLVASAAAATVCEWKGRASYLDLRRGERLAEAATWTYHRPNPPYRALSGHFAFYAGRVDLCLLDEEEVSPQGGTFYGGWVTAEVVGPHKGEPGTEGW